MAPGSPKISTSSPVSSGQFTTKDKFWSFAFVAVFFTFIAFTCKASSISKDTVPFDYLEKCNLTLAEKEELVLVNSKSIFRCHLFLMALIQICLLSNGIINFHQFLGWSKNDAVIFLDHTKYLKIVQIILYTICLGLHTSRFFIAGDAVTILLASLFAVWMNKHHYRWALDKRDKYLIEKYGPRKIVPYPFPGLRDPNFRLDYQEILPPIDGYKYRVIEVNNEYHIQGTIKFGIGKMTSLDKKKVDKVVCVNYAIVDATIERFFDEYGTVHTIFVN